MRRVAITGLGAISPFGTGVDALWQGLIEARSGIRPITGWDASALPVRFGGEVPDFEPTRWLPHKEVKKVDTFIQYGLAAALEAVEDSGLSIEGRLADRTGVYLGSGIGGLSATVDAVRVLDNRGPNRISPFVVPRILINMLAGQVSIRLGARGANFSHVSACATGNHAIGEAMLAIQLGRLDAVVAGAAEEGVVPLAVAGFSRMRALSRRNDDPAAASRPFDADRDGFVLGSGAGVVVLEELEHARARGARIYAELAGYGASSDAFHMTQPAEGGEGGARCMRQALEHATANPDEIDYINAHGTSTPFNDQAEVAAIKSVFGAHAQALAVSSTKSMTGHLLGAAGGIESVICARALFHQVVPPTLNLTQPQEGLDLDFVPGAAREARVRAVVSNAFGFGGTNASLVFRARP